MKRKKSAKEPVIVLLVISCVLVLMIDPVLVTLPIVALGAYFLYKNKQGKKRRNALLMAGDIDSMTGGEFEEMLEVVFFNLGYKTKLVGKTGDFGVDLILSRGPERIAVQAKRYSANVGNKAVQEVYAGMTKHKATAGWVITNSDFTRAAVSQAKSCNVKLVNRDKLLDLIAESKKPRQDG